MPTSSSRRPGRARPSPRRCSTSAIPAEKGSDRKDRFVANLAVNGQTLTGTTQSLGDKLPVTVKLVRKPTGDSFEFRGQISIGQTVTEVTSTDNSDLSEKEFQDNQTSDDGITPAPKDFTEVSPESIGVRVKLDAALDFLKGLKGQAVEVALSSLAVTCDALRAGEQTINLSADPDRAAALIAKSKSPPGVVAAGWTSGMRRDGPHHPLSRRRLARRRQDQQGQARGGDLRRADQDARGEVGGRGMERQHRKAETDVQAAEPAIPRARPHRDDRDHRAGVAGQARRVRQADAVDQQSRDLDGGRGAGAKLNLSEESSGDEEGDQRDDNGSVEALAKEFKGQRWDADKSAWK